MLRTMPSDAAAEVDAPETRLLRVHADLWRADVVRAFGAPRSQLARLDLEERAESCDVAVVYLPKARRRREYLIALAASCATRLAVVGHKRAGIKSTTKRLRELGDIVALEHGSHCQLVMVKLGERGAPPKLDEWEESFEAKGLSLVTLPGVFSDGRLDEGSGLLLDHLVLPTAGSLLDLGCGSGVLGLWAKRTQPALDVTLSDVDDLSVESARRSARRNDLDVTCVVSDVFSAIDQRFDRIVTNPPFHQGVDTDYDVTGRIIGEAPKHLAADGELWLVANHFLPWREPLETHFPEVELVHSNRRFKVWRARSGAS